MLFSIGMVTLLISCGSSRPKVITTKKEAREIAREKSPTKITTPTSRKRRQPVSPPAIEIDDQPVAVGNTVIDNAIREAMAYKGVRYQYGGSSRKGMDCSGLINLAFLEAGETVPRTSASLLQASKEIDVQEVQRGDLMFFATGRNRKRVNHVALVVAVTPAEIQFIHATVSQGVTVSSFNEPYWLGKYHSAGRLF
jgi:cell wall-associated NlpC family hydrolase